jgi:hypothetical protein
LKNESFVREIPRERERRKDERKMRSGELERDGGERSPRGLKCTESHHGIDRISMESQQAPEMKQWRKIR